MLSAAPCSSFVPSTTYDRVAVTRLRAEAAHPLSSSGLAHVMLRVPSVNATVDYYVGRGGRLRNFNAYPTGAATAFLDFGPDDDSESAGYCSLEITQAADKKNNNNKGANKDDDFVVGNAVQYVGLSMLLDFDKTNLESVILHRDKKATVERDPNGLVVKTVASAPGDPLARLCLTIDDDKTDLGDVGDFYTGLLGMEQVAGDARCVCLRYKEDADAVGTATGSRTGVPTTMVFASPPAGDEGLQRGNCFDHFVVHVASVDAAHAFLLQRQGKGDDSTIFMPPTKMFGRSLLGITDPSGYQVYLMERQ